MISRRLERLLLDRNPGCCIASWRETIHYEPMAIKMRGPLGEEFHIEDADLAAMKFELAPDHAINGYVD